jgi:hypothetical protein
MATFDMPAFTSTARPAPLRNFSRVCSTGAPTTLDCVVTPATTAGTSLTISARSRARGCLMPQAVPAARKPGTMGASEEDRAMA